MIKTKLKTKLKTGDLVKVISGEHSGKTDYISKINFEKNFVYLKEIFIETYDKSTPENKEKSQLKKIMKPINISNVAYFLEKEQEVTKIGLVSNKSENEENVKKVRFSRKYKFAIS